jgi:hypothetical protein
VTCSRCLFAESITATSIASETKSPGGRDGLLIPSRRRGCSGFRRAASNEGGRIYSPSLRPKPCKRILLLSFDGASYQASEGYVVEFTVRRTDITAQRPHGVSYALVFRPANGEPFVRFDNAHVPSRPGGKYVKTPAAYDHWHRDEHDIGRPYKFTTALQLLEDFWREVKRVMDERGIPNDL